MNRLVTITTGTVAAASLACASMSAHDEAANAAINHIYQRFSAAYDSLDADAVGALYTEDALYLAPDGDIIRGRSAIRTAFDRFFASVRAAEHSIGITFTSTDRSFARTLATDVGYFDLVTDSAGRRVGQMRGKYVTVWLQDVFGVWRVHVDTYNAVEP